MYFMLIPLLIISLYVIRLLNSKKHHSFFIKIAIIFLFLVSFMCQLIFVYKVLDYFGYSEGAIAAWTLLVSTVVFFIVLINFTKPPNKQGVES